MFYQPLKQAILDDQPIVKELVLKEIFSPTLQVIINYNMRFLSQLEPRVKNWSPSQMIGDVFLEVVKAHKLCFKK